MTDSFCSHLLQSSVKWIDSDFFELFEASTKEKQLLREKKRKKQTSLLSQDQRFHGAIPSKRTSARASQVTLSIALVLMKEAALNNVHKTALEMKKTSSAGENLHRHLGMQLLAWLHRVRQACSVQNLKRNVVFLNVAGVVLVFLLALLKDHSKIETVTVPIAMGGILIRLQKHLLPNDCVWKMKIGFLNGVIAMILLGRGISGALMNLGANEILGAKITDIDHSNDLQKDHHPGDRHRGDRHPGDRHPGDRHPGDCLMEIYVDDHLRGLHRGDCLQEDLPRLENPLLPNSIQEMMSGTRAWIIARIGHRIIEMVGKFDCLSKEIVLMHSSYAIRMIFFFAQDFGVRSVRFTSD